MKRVLKVSSIIFAFIFLTLIAVLAGMSLAIWDTGSNISEVYAMVHQNNPAMIGDKQVIEIDEGNIKDYLESDEFKEMGANKSLGQDDNDLKEITKNGGIKPEIGSNNRSTEPEETKTEEPDEKQSDEREPLEITPEISGIAAVVRAGDEENIIENELPVPTQNVKVDENIDPLANYPLPYGEVDKSYFDDALFIGDSRVAGLAMNSGTNATFYAVTSFQLFKYKTFKVVQTPSGKVPIFEAMPYDKFTKIYIKVGLNELGSVSDEPFLQAYEQFINDLRVMQPRAIIYIQAILPVTQVKSETDRVHCNENIKKRNENLKTFAEHMKCYYVDVGAYFADETGALKADATADGIHMYSKYMPLWIDALAHNAVAWPPQSSEQQ